VRDETAAAHKQGCGFMGESGVLHITYMTLGEAWERHVCYTGCGFMGESMCDIHDHTW
jgi:hypothetical protein